MILNAVSVGKAYGSNPCRRKYWMLKEVMRLVAPATRMEAHSSTVEGYREAVLILTGDSKGGAKKCKIDCKKHQIGLK